MTVAIEDSDEKNAQDWRINVLEDCSDESREESFLHVVFVEINPDEAEEESRDVREVPGDV